MTARLMKSGIEVLGDLLSFFESSTAFISVACEKLRKQHGPNFNLATVKAILNLRTDVDKHERAEALSICKDVLDSYQDGRYDLKLKQKKGNTHTAGIFSELDMTQAEKSQNQQKQADKEKDKKDALEEIDEDEIEFELDDFFKQGGLDVEQMQAPKIESIEKYASRRTNQETAASVNKDVEPDESMKGYLNKYTKQINDGASNDKNILKDVVGGVGGGLKLGASILKDTIGKAVPLSKLEKQFFALKNGYLYWYQNEKAKRAQGSIIVKNIEAIEISSKNKMQI